jgi:2-polyprenyl-3-methyl-5-hydroxy-6-metoxy-1,4-benzoquinol methylase
MQTKEFNTLNEILSEIDKEIDAVVNVMDADMRVELSKISHSSLSMALGEILKNIDPFSEEYVAKVEKIHKTIIGKSYSVMSEGLPGLDVNFESQWGFPYGTQSFEIVGEFLIAYGHLIKMMELPRSAKILEIGCGLGSLTFFLAKMGYQVDALDVNKAQCEIVEKLTNPLPTKVNVICEPLDQFLNSCIQKYDAIIFFESFHHFLNHHNLLKILSNNHLTNQGIIILAAEPVMEKQESYLPYSWGCRLDGESLRAMRKWGWLELGFTSEYIEQLAERLNLKLVSFKTEISKWSSIIILRQNEQE